MVVVRSVYFGSMPIYPRFNSELRSMKSVNWNFRDFTRPQDNNIARLRGIKPVCYRRYLATLSAHATRHFVTIPGPIYKPANEHS